MNLISKSLTRIECSPLFHPQIPSGNRITPQRIRFHPAAAAVSGSGGKKQRAKAPPEIVTAKKEKESGRPNEIAYEKEAANWVNLIGFVDQPVQFEASSDGKFWAGTVISQRSSSDSSAFWYYFLLFLYRKRIVWCDYDVKVKPRHPDFKSKDSSLSLWLNKAPAWVLPKLQGLEFDVLVPKGRGVKQLKGEESWKELVENPDKWWDNRIDKRNAKAPDFKHKETGEALWLNESPTWVLSKLPPVKKRQEITVS
ncbi:hypothetical protein F2Q68_00037186 [Brassica cretica]|uniref:Uncharacterized protein n=1 Tax=Brassica cretica TaxID=69181 RepID=A0A8S9H1N9_BRACR|nr:hypothetical protein F2Q68_00037186 [Brassica cretica]